MKQIFNAGTNFFDYNLKKRLFLAMLVFCFVQLSYGQSYVYDNEWSAAANGKIDNATVSYLQIDAQDNIYYLNSGYRFVKTNENGQLLSQVYLTKHWSQTSTNENFLWMSSFSIGATGNIIIGAGYSGSGQPYTLFEYTSAGEFINSKIRVGNDADQVSNNQEHAIDNDGNVYILERDTRKIKKFNAAGNFLGLFADAEVGGKAYSIHFSKYDNSIVVINVTDRKVQKFSKSGTLLLTIASTVSAPLTHILNKVTTDKTENIYFQEYSGTTFNKIHKYSALGVYVQSFGSTTNLYESISSLAVDSKGALYVANGTIKVFNADGTFRKDLQKDLTPYSFLASTLKMAVDGSDNMYFGSYMNGLLTLSRINKDGTVQYHKNISNQNIRDIEYYGANNEIYVADANYDQISIYDATTGNFKSHLISSYEPWGLAISGKYLYAINTGNQLRKFDLETKTTVGYITLTDLYAAFVDDFAVDAAGNIFIASSSKIFKYDANGAIVLQKTIPTEVGYTPDGFVLTSSGHIVSAIATTISYGKLLLFNSTNLNLTKILGTNGFGNYGVVLPNSVCELSTGKIAVLDAGAGRIVFYNRVATAPALVVGEPPLATKNNFDVYGSVFKSQNYTVKITNTGNVPLNFVGDKVKVTGRNPEDFIINPATIPASVAVGQSANISFAFKAHAVNLRDGVLELYTNDPAEPKFELRLTGHAGKSTPEITFADGTMSYTESLTLSATASPAEAPISYVITSGSGIAEISGGKLVAKGTGYVTVRARVVEDENFYAALKDASFQITPGTLVVKADNKSREFGSANPTLTFKIEGFKSGENASVISTQPNIYTDAAINAPVGTYDITTTGGTAANYILTHQKGTLTITKANRVVSFSGGDTKVYDGTGFQQTASAKDFSNADLPITYEYKQGETLLDNAPVNAGTYTVTASVDHINYTGANTRTITINKATALISLENATYTYDGSKKSVTVTTEPAAHANNVILTYSQGGVVAEPVNAGVYEVEASLPVENYTATPVTGTLTIEKATQTITFDAIEDVKQTAEPFNIAANSDAGLSPLIFTIVSGPATVSGDQITLTGEEGTVTIKASHAGNENYLAAEAQQSFNVIYDPILSIENSSDQGVSVYPIPASSVKNITITSKDDISSLTITNMHGIVLFTKALKGAKETTVPTEPFLSGIYILSLKTVKGQHISRKIQIIR